MQRKMKNNLERKIKGDREPLTPAEKAKSSMHFSSAALRLHGEVQYDHQASPKKSEPDAKSKSKAASVPKVPAAVAIIAALSSMISPSQSFWYFEVVCRHRCRTPHDLV